MGDPAAPPPTAETLLFEEFPGRSLTVMLFRDVENAGAIRELLVSARMEPEAAFINAAAVPGLLAVHAAAHRALAAAARGALRTRTLHAELVFGLSGSKHIGESLARFGAGPGARGVLAARFDAAPGEAAALAALVAGRAAPLAELGAAADAALVRRLYGVGDAEAGAAPGALLAGAVSRIAARDC